MKKAFDQTVRDLKREVNKTVLKIPKIEQKVLDATSNEPWGPHGSLLADIAQATRNYHEYQMIMGILWKRINDTGKNWRHVYKGLTVLEYLVGHGSERVIDDIREHAYQISTLSDFQYIDSNGRDQGNNVRKKSQNLVALVNDKERIIEVRQKAAANRDKFRSPSSMGSMYRPSSGGYDDRYEGRYGSRDGDRNGDSYGRERDYGFRDDRAGRNEDSYGRDYEERYNRDGFKDDDYRGRSRNIDDYQHGSRSRSSDRDGERTYDDDGQASSRNNGARADEQSQIGRQLERKFSEQNIGAPPPPSYEEAVNESGSTVHSQRDVEAPATTSPRAFPPPTSSSPSQPTTHGTTASPPMQGLDGSDEFDPRGSVPAAPNAAPNASSSLETNLFDSLALVPVGPVTSAADSESHVQTSSVAGSYTQNQTFEDPFGDSPFKAISSSGVQEQAHFHRGESFSAATYSTPGIPVQPQPNLHHPREETLQHHNIGVLADLLPPETLPAAVSQPTISNQPVQPNFQAVAGLPAQPNSNLGNYQQDGNIAPVNFQNQTEPGREFGNGMFMAQGGIPAHVNSYMAPPNAGSNTQPNNFGTSHNGSAAPTSSHVTLQTTRPAQLDSGNFNPPHGSVAPVASQASHQASNFPVVKSNLDVMGSFNPQAGNYTSMAPQQIPPAGSLSTASQASKNKFETKSTVWSDTLSRGLVNLNISGPKTNPMADIGVDFEALNRKEKRMEKPSTAPVVSTINMGKAMGSGSGIGRAGAGALRPTSNAMSGSGLGMEMGMGMGMNPNPGMGMGMGMGMRGYGGMNQPMGGMGMNMGMGQQGIQMQQPRANMPGVYNPMMGAGGYAPQQPPYGSYR
ncbi:clathrin interactor EPSIN 2-like [Benincasa hispida]|uniref:clathrin interactor EPSIN 2-like n=1 Tax=Benincasa hispida TaxID=102211 RepID=UPI0019015A17|nr:clathrin interactor EPSIN 2-like [Benincasa hispida]XP_038883625.1 clathrin interactor EPSIN 2-like [Benincasa hispida]XP_038883632.1 clathrin interactor EPSIN 2-like [Benincasa hispida]